jgi:hypothetical protein
MKHKLEGWMVFNDHGKPLSWTMNDLLFLSPVSVSKSEPEEKNHTCRKVRVVVEEI